MIYDSFVYLQVQIQHSKNENMRKILILITTLVITNYLSNAQNSHIINTSGNSFSPSSLTINVGDTVTWINTGGNHNVNATQVTFPNNPEGFGNGVAGAPWSFQWVFTISGTYDYQCDPHAPGMSGVITTYCDSYNLAVDSITATSANLNWTANGPTSFLVKYKLSGTVGWNTSTNGVFSTTVTTNNASLSLLTPSTTYEWRIRPYGCTTSTNWFDGPDFTTSNSCNLISSISVTNATCDNTMNGSAALTISGGATPYTFLWDNGNTTQNLNGVLAGTYSVQITDDVGCTLSDTAIIGFVGINSVSQTVSNFIPNPLTNYNVWSYDTLSLTNTGCDTRIRPEFIISCSTGNIQQGDLKIKWLNPATNAWPNIPYTIDGNGNAYGYWSTTSNTIHDSTGFNLPFGNSNIIRARVKFVNPALYGTYTATWETFEVDNLGNKIQSLAPSSSVSLSLVDCSTFSIDSVLSSNASCTGGLDGSATVFSILNGSGSYSYLWSNGDTNASATNLAAGTYSCIVTDSNWGCIDSTDIIITQPDTLTALLTGTNITCNGVNDGTLNASGMGGAGQYDIIWVSHPGLPPVPNQTNLAPDTYIINVIDLNCGDVASASYTLTEPSALIISTSSTNNTSCDPANCNGSITMSLSGGTQPYSYMWTNGYTDSIRNDLCGATYTIDATDANTCTLFTENITIYDSSFTPSALVTGTNISCNGMNDGLASAMISTGGGSSGGNVSTLTYCASSPGTNSYANIELVRLIGDGDSIVNNTAGICDTYEDYTAQYTTLTPGQSYSIDVNLGTCDVTGGTVDSAGIFIDWNIDGDFTDPGEMVGVFGGIQSPTSNTISFIVPNGYYGTTRMRVVSQAQINNSGFPDGPVSSCAVGDFGALGTYNQPWYGATEDYSIVIVGVVPATYLWNTGDTTNIISNLSAGTYYCEITDTNNCSSTDTIIITEPDLISTIELKTNVSCNGLSDGSITLTISGGTSPYVSNWNAADTNNLSVGIYNYTITDNNNCTFSDSINISEPIALTNSYSSININCNGASTGDIDITPLGGTSPYTFSWDNGAITEDLTNISAGQYIVSITDANNCVLIDTIIITEPLLLYSSFTQTNVSCYGLNDGSATVNFFGGVTDYILSWDTLTYTLLGGVSVFTTPIGVPAGIYPYMVTDNNGCIIYDTITIIEPSQIVSTPTITNVSCYGLSDGSASVSISGGIPTYAEDWGTNNPLSLSAGTYNYSITDGNSCIIYDSVTITQPNVLSATSIITNVSCFGIADGATTVNISGGTTDYILFWDTLSYPLIGGLSTFITPIGVPAGTYPFSITDNNGCSFLDTIIINQPAAISVTETISNVSCNGGHNGMVILSISGGTPGFIQDWGVNNPDSLALGTYSYTVTDGNTCTFSDSVTITEPTAITSSISITHLTSCLVASGSLDLTPVGGVSPYTYLWNNNDTTEDISSLSAGNYMVTITDANGCTATNSASISQPSNGLALSLIASNYNGYNISCYNGNNGTIIINSSGGLGALSFVWSSGDTTQNLSSLSEGSYSVTMTDSVGCSLTDSIILTEPTQLSSNFTSTDASCFGIADGGAVVNFLGGVTGVSIGDTNYILGWAGTPLPLYLPFPYTIFNTALLPAPYNGVPAGIYPYTVTDMNGCSQSDTIIINQPDSLYTSLIISNYNGNNISCNGFIDGFIDIQANGGTSAYTYYFNNALITNPSISGLSAGTYTDSIIDNNGCVFTETITLTEPAPLNSVLSTVNTSCNGVCDGTINTQINGGTIPYSYLWNNSSTNSNLDSLCIGNYILTITDTNGCALTDSAIISEPTAIVINLNFSTNVSFYGGNDGFLLTSASGGASSFTYQWTGPNLFTSTSQNINNLSAGTYYLTVTDSTGCYEINSFVITQPLSLTAHLDSVINLSCNGICTGELYITADGGDSVYTYLWIGPNGYTSTDEDLDSLCAGNYILELSDTTNTVTLYFEVLEPTPVTIVSIADTAICYNGTAQANAYVYGGSYPYQTLWSDGSTNISTILPAGIHTVSATDADGCIATDSITVHQADSISINSSVINVSCYGLQDAEVTLSVTNGGTTPFQYSKNNGINYQTGNTFYNLQAGTVNFLIIDANGCNNTITSTISEPEELVSTITTTNTSCYGECDGTATSNVNGGTSPYSFNWGGSNPNNLCAGFYNVIVTDANGCLATNSIIITEPNPAIINIWQNGSTIEATTGFVSYQWYDESGNAIIGATNDTFTPTTQGEYSVEVTDINGCSIISYSILVIIDYINQHEIKLTIYPNPTKGKLTIESSEYLSSISVLNSVGNRLIFIDNNITFEKQISIDLSPFAKGIFFIQIELNNQLINHRIILQ